MYDLKRQQEIHEDLVKTERLARTLEELTHIARDFAAERYVLTGWLQELAEDLVGAAARLEDMGYAIDTLLPTEVAYLVYDARAAVKG